MLVPRTPPGIFPECRDRSKPWASLGVVSPKRGEHLEEITEDRQIQFQDRGSPKLQKQHWPEVLNRVAVFIHPPNKGERRVCQLLGPSPSSLALYHCLPSTEVARPSTDSSHKQSALAEPLALPCLSPDLSEINKPETLCVPVGWGQRSLMELRDSLGLWPSCSSAAVDGSHMPPYGHVLGPMEGS